MPGDARIIQDIIAGIGFNGGGAIHPDGQGSGPWHRCCREYLEYRAISLSVAFDRFEIALILSLLNFLTLVFFRKAKKTIDDDGSDSAEKQH